MGKVEHVKLSLRFFYTHINLSAQNCVLYEYYYNRYSLENTPVFIYIFVAPHLTR